MEFQDETRAHGRRSLWRDRPAVLLWMAIGLAACSPGEAELVNPGTSRDDLGGLPDTTRIGAPIADRSFRPKIATGDSPVLLVSRDDATDGVVYLRFSSDALPDTAGVTAGWLGLRFRVVTGSAPVILEAREVSPDAAAWTEEDLRSPGRDRIDPPFYRSPDPIDPGFGDTLFVEHAIEIPDTLLRRWKNDPEHNRGLALSLAAGTFGAIEILAKEAGITDDDGILLPNPRLEILHAEADTARISPIDDAYVLEDQRDPASGSDTTLYLSGRPAERLLLRFGLDGTHVRKGDTIHRARLRLRVDPTSMAAGESLQIAVYRAESPWEEASEPDSVNRANVATGFARIRANSDTLELDFASTLQFWLDGGENNGLQLRLVPEGRDALDVRLFSREASVGRQPWIDVLVSHPPDPRWSGGTP